MEEINRAPPHAPLVFPRAFIIFCWSTCTVNVRNKEKRAYRKRAAAVWLT